MVEWERIQSRNTIQQIVLILRLQSYVKWTKDEKGMKKKKKRSIEEWKHRKSIFLWFFFFSFQPFALCHFVGFFFVLLIRWCWSKVITSNAKRHINLLLSIENYWTSNFATIGYDKIAFTCVFFSFRNFFFSKLWLHVICGVQVIQTQPNNHKKKKILRKREKKNVFRWRRWWRHRSRLPIRFNWTICELLKCAVHPPT